MRRLSLAHLVALLGVLPAAGALAPAASADVFLMTNGDILYGQMDGTTLPLETPNGVVQVSTGDLRDVHVGVTNGDAVRFKNGTVLVGWLAQPSYSLRLATGQTVTVERSQLSLISFPTRR